MDEIALFTNMGRVLIACICVALFYTERGYAAEIYVSSGGENIYLIGDIESGDLNKLADAVLFKVGLGYDPVLILHSYGGDIEEGLKIASFVQDMWLRVEVSQHLEPTGLFRRGRPSLWDEYNGVEVDENGELFIERRVLKPSLCLSACAVIAVASPELIYLPLDGPSIGFHRPYILPQLNARLSADESRQLYEIIEEEFQSALLDFAVPRHFVEQVMQTSSDNILMIGFDEWISLMSGRLAWYEEFMAAKCGSLTPDENHYIEEIFGAVRAGRISFSDQDSDARFAEISTKSVDIARCVSTERRAHHAMIIRNYSDRWSELALEYLRPLSVDQHIDYVRTGMRPGE